MSYSIADSSVAMPRKLAKPTNDGSASQWGSVNAQRSNHANSQ
jgi:hypothetical protein